MPKKQQTKGSSSARWAFLAAATVGGAGILGVAYSGSEADQKPADTSTVNPEVNKENHSTSLDARGAKPAIIPQDEQTAATSTATPFEEAQTAFGQAQEAYADCVAKDALTEIANTIETEAKLLFGRNHEMLMGLSRTIKNAVDNGEYKNWIEDSEAYEDRVGKYLADAAREVDLFDAGDTTLADKSDLQVAVEFEEALEKIRSHYGANDHTGVSREDKIRALRENRPTSTDVAYFHKAQLDRRGDFPFIDVIIPFAEILTNLQNQNKSLDDINEESLNTLYSATQDVSKFNALKPPDAREIEKAYSSLLDHIEKGRKLLHAANGGDLNRELACEKEKQDLSKAKSTYDKSIPRLDGGM